MFARPLLYARTSQIRGAAGPARPSRFAAVAALILICALGVSELFAAPISMVPMPPPRPHPPRNRGYHATSNARLRSSPRTSPTTKRPTGCAGSAAKQP
jgi:hypothetical protein